MTLTFDIFGGASMSACSYKGAPTKTPQVFSLWHCFLPLDLTVPVHWPSGLSAKDICSAKLFVIGMLIKNDFTLLAFCLLFMIRMRPWHFTMGVVCKISKTSQQSKFLRIVSSLKVCMMSPGVPSFTFLWPDILGFPPGWRWAQWGSYICHIWTVSV